MQVWKHGSADNKRITGKIQGIEVQLFERDVTLLAEDPTLRPNELDVFYKLFN
jgi:hypothetical protein